MPRFDGRWLALAVALGCSSSAPDSAPGAEFTIAGDSLRPSLESPLPTRTEVFDGKRVRVRAARGETVAIAAYHTRETVFELRLEAPQIEIRPFAVGWANVVEPSTTMYGPQRGKGHYADELIPVAGAVTGRGALFDLAVGKDAAAGTYAGVVRVGERDVPVELEVLPVTIDVRERPLVWAYYDQVETLALHPGGGREVLDAYVELFRDHGVVLGNDLHGEDWRKDAPALRGLGFWPASIDRSSPAGFLRTAEVWAERFRGEEAIPFAIPVDEPGSLYTKAIVRLYGGMLERAGIGGEDFALAVTDAPHPIYGDAIDIYISPLAIPAPAGSRARHWTYNGKPPRAGNMVIDAPDSDLRSWGWIGFRYDVELWYVWQALYFRDRYNGGPVSDPSKNAITYDERGRSRTDFGNGDGWLAYPGVHPSLRLKTMRRGLQDRALLLRLAACAGREPAAELARSVVPRALAEAGAEPAWPSDPQAWAIARDRVLDALGRPECEG